MRRIAFYGSVIIIAHASTVVWHLLVLAEVSSTLTVRQVATAAAAINAVPAIALILLWTPFRRLAGLLLFLALGTGLLLGGYEHLIGPDNMFRMAAGSWTLPFRASAVLLLLLEGWGCWIGIVLLRGLGGSQSEGHAPAKSSPR